MASVEPTERGAPNERNEQDIVEECTQCGSRQPHDVAVEIRTESDGSENAAFSREPYRVAECSVCGAVTSTRMNNA